MPRIPTSDALGQQRTNPLPTMTGVAEAQVSTSTPGGAFGGNQARQDATQAQGIEKLAGAIDRVGGVAIDRAVQLQNEADAAAVMDLYTGKSASLRDGQYGQNGILMRRGKDAQGAAKDTAELASKLRDEGYEALTSPQQKAMFTKLWQSRMDTAMEGASRHEAEQFQQYRDEATKALVSDAVANAIEGYNDPTAISHAIDVGTVAIRANNNGASAEVIQMQVDQFQSAVHKGVIQRLVAKDPEAARIYFQEADHKLSGADNTTVESWLKEADQRGREQKATADIMGKANTLEEALAAARKLPSEIRDGVAQRVSAQFAQQDAALARQTKLQGAEAWDIINGGGTLDDLSPDLLTDLKRNAPDTVRALSAEVETRWNRSNKLPDMSLVMELKRQSVDNPAAFYQRDLGPLLGQLGDKADEIINLQVAAGRQVVTANDGAVKLLATNSAEQVKTATVTQALDRVAGMLGISPGKAGGSSGQIRDAALYNGWLRGVDLALAKFQVANGREASTEEVMKIATGEWADVTFKGKAAGWFGPKDDVRKLYNVDIDALTAKDLNSIEIPPDIRKQIVDSYVNAGISTFGPEAIARAYLRSLRGF